MYLSNKSIDKKVRKEAAKIKKELHRRRLKITRDKLHERIPKSELWFRELYFDSKLNKVTDEFNEIVGPYIADVVNNLYMYVIEIDGGIHELSSQVLKDFNKTKYLQLQGYKVFRVKAYSKDSFRDFQEALETYLRQWLEE